MKILIFFITINILLTIGLIVDFVKFQKNLSIQNTTFVPLIVKDTIIHQGVNIYRDTIVTTKIVNRKPKTSLDTIVIVVPSEKIVIDPGHYKGKNYEQFKPRYDINTKKIIE